MATDTPNANFDWGSFAADSGLGAALAPIPGAKFAGVNGGKNSMLSVAKQIATKLRRGEIGSLSAKTAGKMAGATAAQQSNSAALAASVGAGQQILQRKQPWSANGDAISGTRAKGSHICPYDKQRLSPTC